MVVGGGGGADGEEKGIDFLLSLSLSVSRVLN